MRDFIKRKEDFECEICHAEVKGNGYTDHCPVCLFSKHVDVNPGDRMSGCGGMMEPVHAVYERTYIMITYKCMKCGAIKQVKAAAEDNQSKLESLLGLKASNSIEK
ncbi:MAG: RNHCP domain-containing protein [Candidatus Micrarchaeia archaeon]